MPNYHPPKPLSNAHSTIATADLSYEAHGKCGCQTIILSDGGDDTTTVWSAASPSSQPEISGCTDYSNVYKVVAIENTKFRGLHINNIAESQINSLIFAETSFILKTNSELLADFTMVDILSGTVMLYRDCDQS
tara:strand:- start:16507 stop:16908 length:402 start_codon:yes stop_codon:yes gene_type:complete